MTFSDKLTFLLNLSGAANADLARAIGVDPSQISRLRKGTRGAPRKNSTIEAMSNFFSLRCSSDYQRSALSEAIHQPAIKLTYSEARISAFIQDWLRSDTDDSSKQVVRILHDIESISLNESSEDAVMPKQYTNHTAVSANAHAYYGNSGKRSAVNVFIDYLLTKGTPCEVLISSDESTEWLLEDSDYSASVVSKMARLTELGYTCKRISSSFSDFDAALDSLTRWLPVYLTGGMTTYYYPRLRDNVYRRTILVAPGQVAVVSSSIGYQPENYMTFILYDPHIVDGYVKDFSDYIDICLPLTRTHIYEKNPQAFARCISHFQSFSADIFSRWQNMSIVTLPGPVIDRVESLCADPVSRDMIKNFRRIQRTFEDNMAEGLSATEMISLYTPEQVKNGEALICPSVLLPNAKIAYTVEDYRLHLMRILGLLQKYPNYRVVVYETDVTCGELHVKEGCTALIVRTSDSFTLFDLMEQNTVAACREYLTQFAMNYGTSTTALRKRSVDKIQNCIDELK